MSLQGYERDDAEAELDATGRCPHCDNTDRGMIEGNGASGPELTLLCIAKVKPQDASVLVYGFDPAKDTDAQGMVPCGHQWSPHA